MAQNDFDRCLKKVDRLKTDYLIFRIYRTSPLIRSLQYVPDFIKENLVTDWGCASVFGPIEFVVVTKLEQLLSHNSLLLDRVDDVLVNSEIKIKL